jgi:fibronectin type 3 domain-containing protein
VQTIVPLTNKGEAESELTQAKITPEVPPPPAPTDLVAVPAPNSIELTWEASTGDVAGYRIYRASAAGDFENIADVNTIPTYSDHGVEHGKTYRYAVTALDQAGREGPRSAIKEVSMP